MKDLKTNPNCDKHYEEALKKYLVSKSKKEKEKQGDDPSILVDKLYKKFPKADPDSQINEIEFLQSNLYKASELTAYYSLAKENGFDLSKKILDWAKKLMKLIYNKK